MAAADGAKTVQRIRVLAKSEEQVDFEPIDLSAIVHEVVEPYEAQVAQRATAQRSGYRAGRGGQRPAAGPGQQRRAQRSAGEYNLERGAGDARGAADRYPSRKGRGSAVVIALPTHGAGMSEETKRRIFDPFFTTRGREGTGLGLSIADAIISKHGGDIAVESELGKGTRDDHSACRWRRCADQPARSPAGRRGRRSAARCWLSTTTKCSAQ